MGMASRPSTIAAMAGNMIGTLTVLLVAVLGFMTGRPEFLDIALVYVLISFVSTIAVLRVYVARRDFFVESAAAQGLDLSAFERCLDSDEMLARLQRLDQQRRDEGVRQRPTFKVAAAGDQGELVLGNQAFSVFADVIDAQLAAP